MYVRAYIYIYNDDDSDAKRLNDTAATGVCKINARSKNTRYDPEPPLPPKISVDELNISSGSACKINTRFCKTVFWLSCQH